MYNILFLLRYFPSWGGGETVSITLANYFITKGHKIKIAYFNDYTKGTPPFVSPKIETLKLEHKEFDNKLINELNLRTKNESFDFVINQWWPSDFAFNYFKKNHPESHIIDCWHMPTYTRRTLELNNIGDIIRFLSYPIYRVYEKKRQIRALDLCHKMSDSFVFLSKSFLEQYKEISNDNNFEDCFAISNPLPYTEKVILPHKEKNILVVARMDERHKKITRILKVWKKIMLDPSLNDWTLKIVGDGPDLNTYKKMSKSMNLKNIDFEGFQNPSEYYKKASIFLMTSETEGFGMTLIEALYHGVIPVVMDSFLALHDIISNSENGFITPNKDLYKYEKSLIKIMKDKELREKMQDKCILSTNKFSIEKIGEDWEELFNKIR